MTGPLVDDVASFVLAGTVEEVHAAHMSSVPVSARTAVVRVDDVIRSPDLIAMPAGSLVTIELSRDAAAGDRALFFAEGWMYGRGIALRELRRADRDEAEMDRLRAWVAGAAERALQRRLVEAELVVLGRVAAVDAAFPADPLTAGFRSEHDPLWQRAHVAVEEALKGDAGDHIEIVFPGSMDMMWFRAPKPAEGQRGIWLLQRIALTGFDDDVLAVPDPLDARGAHERERIVAALRGPEAAG